MTRVKARKRITAVGAAALIASLAGIAYAHSGAWGLPQKIDEINGNSSELNTAYLDGCPIQSPDGLSLYMASNRPRYIGDTRTDLDIWVAHRRNKHAPFGAPQNVASPVNTTADDFCPTPIRDQGLFFASRRVVDGACGGADIYFTRFNRRSGWSEPQHFGCQVDGGPNGVADEQGPSYLRKHDEAVLYFSSGPDIYVSEQLPDGTFGPADTGHRAEQHVRRLPSERPEERARDRLRLEPLGHAGRPGPLLRNARQHRRSVVDAGQPRTGCEHEQQRDTWIVLAR